jgi:hypothetical protein
VHKGSQRSVNAFVPECVYSGFMAARVTCQNKTEANMTGMNGDNSRFPHERKQQKIARRLRNRKFLKNSEQQQKLTTAAVRSQEKVV